MRGRGTVSSVHQVSAWLIVAAGLPLYGALVLVLGMIRVSPSLSLPWWVGQAVPPILYAIIVRLTIRRVSVIRWVVATLCLWGVHGVLGMLTAAALTRMGPLPFDMATSGPFPPLAVPGIFWVPLLLVPFRDLVGGHPPAPPRRRTAVRQSDGVHHDGTTTPAQVAPPAMAQSGMSPKPRKPGPGATTSRPLADKPGSGQTGSVRHPSPVHRGPAGGSVAPGEATPGAAPVVDAAGCSPRRLDEEPAHDASPVLVRVSFARVIDQFPPGMFHESLDRVGASLAEPGHLLIPQRLVLAQLAEGFVRAGWEVVAGQIPRHLLSMTDEEITQRLADGQLVLPLDELVPQLPRDLFALTGRALDVESIQSVPAPFQPVLAAEDAQRATGDRPSDVASIAAAQAVTKSRASNASWSVGDEAGTDRPAGVAVLDDVEIAPGTMAVPEGDSLEGFVPSSRPVGDDGAPSSPPPADRAAEPVPAMPDRDEIAPMDRVIAALAPLRPLHVGVESAEGLTLVTVSPSGPGKRAALAAGRLLLPLLAERRAPWPVIQLTMRGADVALILTPLGPLRPGGSLLASSVLPEGALASVERLLLRAVISGTSGSDGSARRDPDQPEAREEPNLLDAQAPTPVRQIAASLDALGAVTASVLSDAEAERDFYVFLPEGSDVRKAGQFAGELDQAVRKVAELGPAFHTAVLRCGMRHLIIRLEHAARGRAAIVVAGGQTDRPGLAYRQVEAAALVLNAR
jgi:hypothetical protein